MELWSLHRSWGGTGDGDSQERNQGEEGKSVEGSGVWVEHLLFLMTKVSITPLGLSPAHHLGLFRHVC